MIYGHASQIGTMYCSIVIGKKTFCENLSKAERRNANNNHSFYAICSKRFYSLQRARITQRQIVYWVARQDGAEAINCLKRLSNKEQCLSLTSYVIQRFDVPRKECIVKKGKP